MRVRLKGKTLKGKNRVREHGEEWIGHPLVIPLVPWPDNRERLLLESKDMRNRRWVILPSAIDPDFEVEVIEDVG